MRVVFVFGAVSALCLALAACGGHPSATPAKAPQAAAAAGSSGGPAGPAAQAAPVRQVDGRPFWASNRKHTAQENATYQFGKNGADFGAASEDDYITRVHAFVASPPAGAQTINRKNGDRLIYDPRANVFAVVSKDGAPRTMFKPRDGAAYWAQQKDREARRTETPGGGDNTDS